MSNPIPHPQPSCQPLLSPSSSSSSYSPLPPYTQISSFCPMTSWQDMQQLPQSWSQLLLGGLEEEEDRCSFSAMQTRRMQNWNDHQVLHQPGGAPTGDLKQESSRAGYVYGGSNQEIQGSWPSWSQTLPTSSPSSCVTSLTSSMLDFSSSRSEGRNHQLDHPSECNNTSVGSAFKKARVQAASAQSTFKVRKEKLGERITSLHQIVSPFGKTDTASVLLEAIGYIRFLQSQIEALSTPYMGSRSGSVRQPVQGEMNCIFPEDPGQLLNDTKLWRRGPLDHQDEGLKKDLRSRGLCLVPMSFMLHVGSDNGADYWAPSMGGACQ